jgi:hypothetical protein
LKHNKTPGPKRGRAYMDFLSGFFPEQSAEPAQAGSSLIVP